MIANVPGPDWDGKIRVGGPLPARGWELPGWFRGSIRWGPALFCAALIFYLSHQSSLAGQQFIPDYVGHLVAYFTLAGSLVWGHCDLWSRPLTRKAAALTWLWSTLYGVLDEFHQMFVPLREASWLDLGVDTVAALAAVLAGLVLSGWWFERS